MCLSRSTPTLRRRGFTLIELMIVVAVIGILVAVALPSFLDSLRKGRRADAVAALAQVQQAQERWRANNNAYTTSLTAAPTADPAGLGLSATSANAYYAISVDAASGNGYTATANAVTGTTQSQDAQCSTMRVRLVNGNVQYGGCGGCGVPAGALTDPHRCWRR